MLKRRTGCYWRGLGVDSRDVPKDKEGLLARLVEGAQEPWESMDQVPRARSWQVAVPNGTRWKNGF